MKPYYWLIIAISALTGFIQVSAQNADTVYITVSLGMVSVVQDGSTITFDASQCYGSINSPRTQKTRVSLFNGATPVKYWYFNDYIFKISGSVVTSTSAWLTAISNLNPGQLKSYRKIAEYRVVASLPTIQDPAVTYLVGNQSLINITGLNGNLDKIYLIEALTINPITNDLQAIRFNSVSTNVYDFRRSSFYDTYAGTSTNATSRIEFNISSGVNSMEQTTMTIHASTGKNRTMMSHSMRSATNQAIVNNQYMTTGIWRDNSTNLTSIQFLYSNISDGYGVGTVISVFALRP